MITALVRTLGIEWSTNRLIKTGWAEISKAAASPPDARDEAKLTHQALDRLSRIIPRLAAMNAGTAIAHSDMLIDLRIGLNVLNLQQVLPKIEEQNRKCIEAVLAAISQYYYIKKTSLHHENGHILRIFDEAKQSMVGDGMKRAERHALRIISSMRLNILIEMNRYQSQSLRELK